MSFIKKLHDIKVLREIAKKLFRGVTITQKFYTGKIYMNAVDHSWAWTGDKRYETYDKELQNKLYEISLSKSKFIDIGSNIGAMSLGVLMRNSNIQVLAVDPNSSALKLLKKSLQANGLSDRCEYIEAVVSNDNIEKNFDITGSVIGHIVNDGGLKVKSLSFWEFIADMSEKDDILVKIDIEGFEVEILRNIPKSACEIKNLTLVFELHPKGLNQIADPNYCIKQLTDAKFKVYGLDGLPLANINESNYTQAIVKH